MRPLLVSLLALGTLAMGGQPPDVPGTTQSAEPYHARFRQLGDLYGAMYVARSVTFSFRDFFGSTIGMCRFSSNGRNHVDLSLSAWDRGSETFREMLVFHEPGYGLLGRGHKNTRHSDGRPESLMNGWLFNERTYQANRHPASG